MKFNPAKLPALQHRGAFDGDTTEIVASFLEPFQGTASFVNYSSAAHHFLHWLSLRGISVSQVDATTVERFSRHRCQCKGYSSAQVRRSVYLGRVGRFVRFLEDRGDIPIAEETRQVRAWLPHYAERLAALGYGPDAQRVHYSGAEHFVAWMQLERLGWDAADDAIDRFVQHDCRCSMRRKGTRLQASGLRKRRRCAREFVVFLRERGMIPPAPGRPVDEDLAVYSAWLRQHCGATETTIARYLQEVSRWKSSLGDPAVLGALTIRDIILGQGPERSRASITTTATVLRSYLRFLTARGECRPELCHAVPTVPRYRHASLPRYADAATIERIIAACDQPTTPAGYRDRAIVLLLARLGLRAGDVRNMRLGDIDWAGGRLRVHGKGRRTENLLLPQEVGDALLAYIEHARPTTRCDHIFLRVLSPHTPFASSSEIAGIVSRVLARGGIKGVPTGSHMFRHSLATRMLREGASLETVGTVLRHRSVSTTTIYAKVDTRMLSCVAQPWPGEASC